MRFFNFSAAMKNSLATGRRVLAYGEAKRGKYGAEMIHPEYLSLIHIGSAASWGSDSYRFRHISESWLPGAVWWIRSESHPSAEGAEKESEDPGSYGFNRTGG